MLAICIRRQYVNLCQMDFTRVGITENSRFQPDHKETSGFQNMVSIQFERMRLHSKIKNVYTLGRSEKKAARVLK